MIILVKLILAHLLGDFLLQPKSRIKEKEVLKLKSFALFIHAFIHGALAMLLVWDINFWRPAIIIILTHAAIDWIKQTVQNEKTKRLWFFIDQILHITIIAFIWYYWEGVSIEFGSIINEKILTILTAIFAITLPASVMIKVLISRWALETEDAETESLISAGKYIGILERLFVFAFVLSGHWDAVGFLIAAKSVFRFGDLRESKDRKLTEYILIGTLLSFGIAIGAGILVQEILKIV